MAGQEATSTYPIKTVVILVQENRSFDHMLGWMRTLNPEIDGPTGTESNPLSTTDLSSPRLFVTENSGYIVPDPGHSIQDIYEQVFGVPWSESNATEKLPVTMQGFAQNAERIQKGLSQMVMSGFKPDAVPVYKELVSEFAVCDRWFAPVPASTQPNRQFVHSATSHGTTSNDTKILVAGFPQKTIFESLEESGHTFGIYWQYPPATLLFRNLRKLKYVDNFHEFGLTFKQHCKEGKLPNYTVIEQRWFEGKLLPPGNDDHPSHDVAEGQRFIKEVYEALRASPQWNEMLFVIVYDEHGGFYDHVPTPNTGVPSPDGIVGPAPYNFQFDRLGVRVPAILISPWIERGTVLHEPSGPYPTSQYEHSSIPATVKKIFNLKEFLTKRDAWAGTFEGLLSRTSPRTDCPVTLPEPVKMRDGGPEDGAKLNDFQQMMVQLAAVLKGDHKKSTFPHELVENMTVAKAVEYVTDGYEKFLEECKKAKSEGKDDDYIVALENDALAAEKKSKSFAQKMFSCLVCDH